MCSRRRRASPLVPGCCTCLASHNFSNLCAEKHSSTKIFQTAHKRTGKIAAAWMHNCTWPALLYVRSTHLLSWRATSLQAPTTHLQVSGVCRAIVVGSGRRSRVDYARIFEEKVAKGSPNTPRTSPVALVAVLRKTITSRRRPFHQEMSWNRLFSVTKRLAMNFFCTES